MKKTILMFLLVFSSIMNAQADKIKVSGKVSDNSGMGVPGVTVAFDDKSTITDLDGKFSLLANSAKTVVTFSYLGFETKKVTVAKGGTMNVSLAEANQQLTEVVVVGYGSMKKDNITGSVSKFKTDALNDQAVSRLDQALQGKIAGVQVQTTSSEAGSDPTIQIRGIASISANAQPLVVVDGQPIQDGLSSLNIADIKDVTVLKDAASASIYGSRGANGVILVTTKSGGDSKTKYTFTSSYGVKSAYKRWDVSSITDYVHNTIKENALRVADGTPVAPNALTTSRRVEYYIENYLNDGPVDYQDAFLNSGIVKNVQLSASGGSKSMNYYVSGGYNSEGGLTIKSDYTKYNFRAKLNVDLSKRVKLDINLNPSYAKTQKPSISDLNAFARGISWLPSSLNQKTVDYIFANTDRNIIANAAYTAPYNKGDVYVGASGHAQFFRDFNVPAYNYLDGSGASAAITTNTHAWNTSGSNPLYTVNASDDDKEDFRIQANTGLSINLAKGLDFRTSISYYSKFSNRLVFTASRSGIYGDVNTTNQNSAVYSKDTFLDLLSENLLTYKKTFNKVHNFDLTGLYSVQKTKVTESTITAQYFPNDEIRTLNAGRTDSYISTGTTNSLALISYMGRLNYSYDSKYDLSASIRTDGSSIFKNNKWAVFPAVSVGWNIAKENFIANKFSSLDKLKLRASYGATGNNRIQGISGLTNSYNPGYNVFDYTSYISGSGSGTVTNGLALPNVFPNADLTWETTYQSNLGLDIAMLKNRLNLSVDVYDSNTKNLLLLESSKAFSGAAQSWVNVGSLNNRGIEIELSTTNINKKNFTWNTSANYSRNVNKLTNFGSLTQTVNINSAALLNLGTSSYSDYYITKVGQPLTQMYGYKTAGVWLSQADVDAAVANGYKTSVGVLTPGQLKLVDINGDGVVNEADRTVIGDPYADFTWGITNNFKIRSFDIGFTLQGVQGIDVYNGETISNESKQFINNFTANHWVSPSNPGDGQTPFEYATGSIKWQLTDYAVEDGSYFKLNDITIGYTLNKDLVKRLGLSKFRLYFSAQNLYYHFANGYKGINPEARNTKGTNPLTTGFLQYQSYAIPKTISTGLEINF